MREPDITGYYEDRTGYIQDRTGYYEDKTGYIQETTRIEPDITGYYEDRTGYIQETTMDRTAFSKIEQNMIYQQKKQHNKILRFIKHYIKSQQPKCKLLRGLCETL